MSDSDFSTAQPRAQGRGRKLLGAGMRTVGRRMGRLIGADGTQTWLKIGEDWFQTLSELRGAAMKLGQLASQYADVLPPALAEQLSRLQAQAQPVSWSELEPVLLARWTQTQAGLVATIDSQPIGVASIGQVHRAVLKDGRQVAVKIQYPGVANAIDKDVDNLRRLLKLGGMLPLAPQLLDQLLVEVRDRLADEVDYAGEAQRLARFRQPAEQFGICVPAGIDELQAEGVLVSSFETGATLQEAAQWSQELRDDIGGRLIDWMFHQIGVLQEVHADPHPGNYAFREDGSVVLYDFGCTRPIDARYVDHFQRMTRISLQRDWEAMHAELARIGSLAEKDQGLTPELQRLYRDCTEPVLSVLEDPCYDYADGQIITDLRAVARREVRQMAKFSPQVELAFVARALSGNYWLLRGLRVRQALLPKFEAFAAQAA
nr:AarF/ABC1/UbiB kinase family protein [Oceanococcus sp. HetDA_MAG_MS8]